MLGNWCSATHLPPTGLEEIKQKLQIKPFLCSRLKFLHPSMNLLNPFGVHCVAGAYLSCSTWEHVEQRVVCEGRVLEDRYWVFHLRA